MDAPAPVIISTSISLLTLVYTILQNMGKASQEHVVGLDKRLAIAEEALKACVSERELFRHDASVLKEENYLLMKRLYGESHETG